MSYLRETTDIESVFATEWALVRPTVPVEYDNTDHEPTVVPYVTLTVVSGTAFQADLGKPINTYRHNGLIVVQAHCRVDEGSAVARGLADDAAFIFRTRHFGAGIVTKTPYLDRVGRNGAYFQANVHTPFHRDSHF